MNTEHHSNPELSEDGIVRAWVENAEAWINVIQQNRVDSRKITNHAIVDAVVGSLSKAAPQSRPKVLDLGCGEGWLCRALAVLGMAVTGIDAVPALIEQARQTEPTLPADSAIEYRTMSYEDVSQGYLGTAFDIVICNFSLLGEQSVTQLFSKVHSLLTPGGCLIIQTLHPDRLVSEDSVKSSSDSAGWQRETWEAFDEHFPAPSPWFSRTQAQWLALLEDSRLMLEEIIEPRHPETDQLMSLILTGRLSEAAE
ncbi:class I SAM-dependent methyltransferase [Pseudomaricurvus sp.]|uniref:class I SAM-dependent methyltransferase n=1 Tax=Pseudomaricurvus sp. TaxID=2004510 RepID=UPI003F6C3ED7